MENVINVIQTLGFPVSICIACLWYCYKLTQQSREDSITREEKLYGQIDSITDSLNEITTNLALLNDRMVKVEMEVLENK